MCNFFREWFLRRKIEQLIVDRRSSYTTTFKRDEEFSSEIWPYLIRRRANFRCEECGETIDIDAHHIKRLEDGGKNILRNGRCLCRKCHPKYRITQGIKRRRDRTREKFIDIFGRPRGTEAFEQYRNCRTRKERRELINKLVEENPMGMMDWAHQK